MYMIIQTYHLLPIIVLNDPSYIHLSQTSLHVIISPAKISIPAMTSGIVVGHVILSETAGTATTQVFSLYWRTNCGGREVCVCVCVCACE